MHFGLKNTKTCSKKNPKLDEDTKKINRAETFVAMTIRLQ